MSERLPLWWPREALNEEDHIMEWPLRRPPIPVAETPTWSLYYLAACPTPSDPTIVWGTDVPVAGLEAYLKRLNADGDVLILPAHVLVWAVGRCLREHPEIQPPGRPSPALRLQAGECSDAGAGREARAGGVLAMRSGSKAARRRSPAKSGSTGRNSPRGLPSTFAMNGYSVFCQARCATCSSD